MRPHPDGGKIVRRAAVVDQPELNVAIFAFLLNYPWEFLQIPLYALAPETLPWQVIKRCSIAAVGDAIIMLASYGMVAIGAGDRWWMSKPTMRQLLGFVAVGVFITVAIEYLASRSSGTIWAWRYSSAMPVLPLVHAGLSPVLQWIILPPLTLWFVRRQLSHLWRAQPADRPVTERHDEDLREGKCE